MLTFKITELLGQPIYKPAKHQFPDEPSIRLAFNEEPIRIGDVLKESDQVRGRLRLLRQRRLGRPP